MDLSDKQRKLLKMMEALELVDASQMGISQKALAWALLTDNEEDSLQLFTTLRTLAACTDEDFLTIEGYFTGLARLRQAAKISEQRSVVKDLDLMIRYFYLNQDILNECLKSIRRTKLFYGLRDNYLNN